MLFRAALALLLFSAGCSKSQLPKASSGQSEASGGQSDKQRCAAGAKSVLGESASVLRCGNLTGSGALQALAVVPLSGFPQAQGTIAASRVVIIRRQGSEWVTELDAHKQITNPAGYIGLDFIDDSYLSRGYNLEISDRRSDDAPGLTLWLTYLDDKGQIEGVAVQVTWNPAVHRFQEFTTNQDPEGFRSEIKNPPHRKKRSAPSKTVERKPVASTRIPRTRAMISKGIRL
jgi:hypothetical protein